MIFDADVHLSLTEPGGLTAEAALVMMDRAGIDQANIWLRPPYMRNIEDANRYVYESAKAHPDRFTATGWVDPHFGPEASMEMLKRCLDMYEMPAVKMNGAQNAYYIDDERHFPIYAYLQEAGRGLAFHIGADFYDFTHPTRAAKVARAFPRLKILMVHMGGSGIPDLGKASIEAAQECPNMLLVGSMISHLRVIEAIQVLGPERLCFGSDAPFALMHAERAAYEAFLPDVVDPDGHALIMGENIRRFLTV